MLLEALLRECDGYLVTEENVRTLAAYDPKKPATEEIPFMPARVLLQDFTGVPAVVDLAAMRAAMQRLGGDPAAINPRVPVHLVIDHSVMVDYFGSGDAALKNESAEFERNHERYAFLRWGQQAFDNFYVVPPASGICHQVNLEYIARAVWSRDQDGDAGTLPVVYPDSLVGTDSHTTMINGLGVAGWGVGGIEAEAVMLGQPVYMLMPEVVGVRLSGQMPDGATATDLVLRVTEVLRTYGVVGKFVEFFGTGLSHLPVADRATIANMAPEYGATMGFFPDRRPDAALPAPHGPRRSARHDGRALRPRAGPLPHRRDARPRVPRRDRPGSVHDRAEPRRAEAPAGPHRSRRRAAGLQDEPDRAQRPSRLRPHPAIRWR